MKYTLILTNLEGTAQETQHATLKAVREHINKQAEPWNLSAGVYKGSEDVYLGPADKF